MTNFSYHKNDLGSSFFIIYFVAKYSSLWKTIIKLR
jgi:hypothetical protein